MNKFKSNRPGLTLLELILSIAIIGIISLAFIPLFVMSAKTNSKSEIALDSTYLGKDAMELAYDLTENFAYNEWENELMDKGYRKTGENQYEQKSNKYINMKFTEEDRLIRVVVKVYKTEDKEELEVQYESLYFRNMEGRASGEK